MTLNATQDKVLVGVRPSGKLHLGHYASVIKPALDYNATVLIARYHAPSEDPSDMRRQLDRFGVNFVFQPLHTVEYFRLLELAPSHLLKAMPQYKAKEKNALMYTYPVLMAHDLIGYDKVIVGEDQRAHIEFARDILPRIGVKCPEAIYSDFKVMDLRHPENKMSKSDPQSCLFLDDPDYERKIKKAITTPEGIANLRNIHKLLTGKYPHPSMQMSKLKARIVTAYEDAFSGAAV